MIVLTVFLLILNQIELHLFQIQKENCQCDDVPFNQKGIQKYFTELFLLKYQKILKNIFYKFQFPI